MEDFISKKQLVVESFNNYLTQEISKEEFLDNINGFSQEHEFVQVDLFKSIFTEILQSIDELSNKELKQRKLMIESYIY